MLTPFDVAVKTVEEALVTAVLVELNSPLLDKL